MQVKHLNTLGVEQVAAAIHTQGLGLADNAVNAAYQFLARNFTLLSQVNSHSPNLYPNQLLPHVGKRWSFGDLLACV